RNLVDVLIGFPLLMSSLNELVVTAAQRRAAPVRPFPLLRESLPKLNGRNLGTSTVTRSSLQPKIRVLTAPTGSSTLLEPSDRAPRYRFRSYCCPDGVRPPPGTSRREPRGRCWSAAPGSRRARSPAGARRVGGVDLSLHGCVADLGG